MCEFQLCIYNEGKNCLLSKITINSAGYCDCCIIPEIPCMETLKKQLRYKLNRADDAAEARDRVKKHKAEKASDVSPKQKYVGLGKYLEKTAPKPEFIIEMEKEAEAILGSVEPESVIKYVEAVKDLRYAETAFRAEEGYNLAVKLFAKNAEI